MPGTPAGQAPAGRYVPDRPIVLIGPMAVGKSVVGMELAKRYELPFLDADQLVVDKHGPISEQFASRGERFFRANEVRAISDVLEKFSGRGVVLSLGGGAVLDSGTQQLLARTTVVYLTTDLETVLPRITRIGSRPLLAADPAEQWAKLAAVRAPVYERLATVTVDTRGLQISEVVDRLQCLLQEETN